MPDSHAQGISTTQHGTGLEAPGHEFIIDIKSRLMHPDRSKALVEATDGRIHTSGNNARPANTALVESWMSAIQQAHEDNSGLLFPLDNTPRGTVAIVPLASDGLLAIRPQDDSICDDASLGEFARIIGLTRRELDVLRLVAAGETPANISEQTQTALSTTKAHIKSIYRKSGCPNVRALLVHLSRIPSINGL